MRQTSETMNTTTNKLQATPEPPKKSECGGQCSRKVCNTAPALWYNVSTQQFYCKACAMMINRMNKPDLCFQATSRQIREIAIRFELIGKMLESAGFPGVRNAISDYNSLSGNKTIVAEWSAVGLGVCKKALVEFHNGCTLWGQGDDSCVPKIINGMRMLNEAFNSRADLIAKWEEEA